MTQFNTQKTTAFYNKITNELISIKGNTVFGTSGSIVLKLYGSFAWTEILAHQLVIELNNIGVYRYGYEDTLRVMTGRDVDGLWKYRSVCEHHDGRARKTYEIQGSTGRGSCSCYVNYRRSGECEVKLSSVMQTAFIIAQESKCLSYKVGAVIVKDGRVISTGYNGTTAGMVNPDEYALSRNWAIPDQFNVPRLLEEYQDQYSEWGRSNIIHAEINSILFAARCGNSIAGATMVCTLSPCMDCAKAIAQSGIKQLVYCDDYPKGSPNWSEFLREAGVEVIKIDRAYLSHLNWDKVVGKVVRIRKNDENVE